jgi:hypothetical protein
MVYTFCIISPMYRYSQQDLLCSARTVCTFRTVSAPVQLLTTGDLLCSVRTVLTISTVYRMSSLGIPLLTTHCHYYRASVRNFRTV